MESKKTPSQKLKEILAQDPDNWVTKEFDESIEAFKNHLLKKKQTSKSESSASTRKQYEK